MCWYFQMFLHETQSNGVSILILGTEISLCSRQIFVENFDKDELCNGIYKKTYYKTNKKRTIRKQMFVENFDKDELCNRIRKQITKH